MLGHNSIRTTQIYAKVVEKKVSEDVQNLKTKLFGATQEAKEEREIGYFKLKNIRLFLFILAK